MKKYLNIFLVLVFWVSVVNADEVNQKIISNDYMNAIVEYKLIDNRLKVTINAYNKHKTGKGGITISIPKLDNKNQILNKDGKGFDSVKVYPRGSKLWSGKYKKTISSTHLVIEGWTEKWGKGESKEVSFSINADDLTNDFQYQTAIHVRAVLLKNRKEFLLPNTGYGFPDQQGYEAESILLDLAPKFKKREENPLDEVIKNADTTKLGELVDSGIDINYKDSNGNNLMMYLAQSWAQDSLVPIAEKLIQKGIDVNAMNQNSETALMHLVMNDSYGGTVIADFQKSNRLDFIEWLVKNGANLSLRNYKGQTALDIAKMTWEKNKHMDIKSILNYIEEIYTQNNKQAKNMVKTKVNQKHTKEINIIEQTSKYTITYSREESILKVWDSPTKRLVEEFTNLNNIQKYILIQDKLFIVYGGNYVKSKYIRIDLRNMSYKEILNVDFGYFFSRFIILDSTVIIPVTIGRYGVVGFVEYNYEQDTLVRHKKLLSICGACMSSDLKFSNDMKYTFIKENNGPWYKVLTDSNEFIQSNQLEPLSKFEISDYKKNFLKSKVNTSDFVIKSYPFNDRYQEESKNMYSISSLNYQNDQKNSKEIFITADTTDIDYTQYDRLFLHNKIKNKSIKIYQAEHYGGATMGAYFEDSNYTTINKNIVVEYLCDGCSENTYYIFNSDGMLLRKIEKKDSSSKLNEDTLKIYNDKVYIVNKNTIEILDDDFKTIQILQNINSDDVEFIDIKQGTVKIRFKNDMLSSYTLSNAKLQTRKYIINEDTWIETTSDGFFSGQGNFKEYIHFIDNKYNVYTINQFYDHFFRPDLVKLKLSGDEEAYQKAINGMTYQEALKNPPPKIAFDSIDDKETKKSGFEYTPITTDSNKTKLAFSIKEHDGGGIGLIRVYQEGKLIQTIGEGEINKRSANVATLLEQEKLDTQQKEKQTEYIAMLEDELGKSIDGNLSIEESIAPAKSITTSNKAGTYEIELDLIAGKNEISIEAFNKTNTVTSYRENITIDANISKRKPKLYVIVAGINNFKSNNEKYQLKYSQKDAQDIKNTIEKKMNTLYDTIEVTHLEGEKVTKANILKAAQDIAKKAKLEDTILFYISTHGKAYKGKLYLVPYNNLSTKNWIDFEQTFQAVQSIKALNQIFILDTCESGKANDIVSSVYDSRASVLARSSGVHMLLATTKGTLAFESQDPKVKNGVFTNQILQALKDKTVDNNKDSIISILELSKRLKEPQNNTEYQYPVIRNVGSDVGLERVE